MSVGKSRRLLSSWSNYLLLWIKLMSLTLAMTLPPVKYNDHISLASSTLPSEGPREVVEEPMNIVASSEMVIFIAGQQESTTNIPNDDKMEIPIKVSSPAGRSETTSNSTVYQKLSPLELGDGDGECCTLYSLMIAEKTFSPQDQNEIQMNNNPSYTHLVFDHFKTNNPDESCFNKTLVCSTINSKRSNTLDLGSISDCFYFNNTSCFHRAKLFQSELALKYRVCNQPKLTEGESGLLCSEDKSLLLAPVEKTVTNNISKPFSPYYCICPYGYKGMRCEMIDMDHSVTAALEKVQSQNEIKEILLKYQQTDRYFIGVTLMALLMVTFLGVLVVVACCTYVFVRLSFTFMHFMVLDEGRRSRMQPTNRVSHVDHNYMSPLDRLKLCCSSREVREETLDYELRDVSFSI